MGKWCPPPESNRHSRRNGILNPARLPIPPEGQQSRAALVRRPVVWGGYSVAVLIGNTGRSFLPQKLAWRGWVPFVRLKREGLRGNGAPKRST